MGEQLWLENRSSAFSEIVDEFDYWRRVQINLGMDAYDDPESDGNRLFFRSGFQGGLDWAHWRDHGEWSGYTIEPADDTGYYVVRHSTKGERSTQRVERAQAAFTRPSDAGKFVIGRMANAIRVDLGLESLLVRMKRSGVDPRLKQEEPTPNQLRFMNQACAGIEPGLLNKYLRRFSLASQPEIYALPLPSQEPMMNVLPLTLGELRNLLTEGMQLTDSKE